MTTHPPNPTPTQPTLPVAANGFATTRKTVHPIHRTTAQPDPRDRTVAVVGGSLVGPATELYLRARGFQDVTTYEALPTARSQSGGVMGLRDETLHALNGPGLDIPPEDVEALADRNVYAYDLVDDGEFTPRGTSAFPGRVTSWDALHAAFRDRVDVRTGHRLTQLTPTDDDRWELSFAHRGTTVSTTADVVVFADGRKSTGRDLLDPRRTARYNGYVTWRGLAEPPEPNPRGFERYYDVRHGRLFSRTAPLRQSNRTYWELSHNLTRAAYHDLVGAQPEDRAFVLPDQVTDDVRRVVARAARHLPDPFRSMIAQSEVAGIPVNDVDLPTSIAFYPSSRPSARRSPAVLVGDAIVPIRLQVGAGLNQGLLQARDLAAALDSTTPCASIRDWQEATLARLAPIVELGRSRAHRINLGWYLPVQPGRTTAPASDQWDTPKWVTA